MSCLRLCFFPKLTNVFLISDMCPLGTFPCSTGGVCVPQKSVCNSHFDCSNGEDEDPVLCCEFLLGISVEVLIVRIVW